MKITDACKAAALLAVGHKPVAVTASSVEFAPSADNDASSWLDLDVETNRYVLIRRRVLRIFSGISAADLNALLRTVAE